LCIIFIHFCQIFPKMMLHSSSYLMRRSTRGALLSASFQRAYHPKVIEHYQRPRNVGSLDKADPSVGTGLVGAPACGDVMKLQIKVSADGRTIEDVKFKTFGCGSAIASSSLATEWIKGRTLAEAMTVRNTDIAKELCLPPVKLHCSMLAEDAIKSAIRDFQAKRTSAPLSSPSSSSDSSAK
jgi:Fe-S cluster assembly scaffold IscU